MHIGNELFLYESDDEITIRCRLQFNKYEIQVRLQSDVIEVVKDGKQNVIPINCDSIIWISADQGGPTYGNPFNTSAEIYIKNGDKLSSVINLLNSETVNDLRKTKTYELIERLAKQISAKYNIPWEYKYSIDTPEKDKRRSVGLLMGVLVWVLLILLFLLTRKG